MSDAGGDGGNAATPSLEDRVCIVAGGGGGLGAAVAKRLAEYGATVVVNDLGTAVDGSRTTREPAEETAEAIRTAGGRATAHVGDVTSTEYAETLVSDAVAEYGDVDGVIDFAGILRDGYLTNLSDAAWDDVVRVHLRGHFVLLRAVARHWKREAESRADPPDRSFVCVSSHSAFGNVGQSNYGAAKAGVLGLMRTAALELDAFGVRTNALLPVARSRMTDDFIEEGDLPPEKVAPVAAYLLSEASAPLNGRTLRAEGDAVALVSDPQTRRVAVRDGGWSLSSLAERLPDVVERSDD